MNNQFLLAKPIHYLIIIGIFFFMFLGQKHVIAEEKEININTNPNGYLFQIDNLKPGDWMPRNITIKNDGKQDFKYTSKTGKSRSVKGLFEELELIVKKDATTLYKGKLKEFKGFTPRELAQGSEEILFFQVTMPYDLGNEFQGSSAEVEIIFLAEAINETSNENDPTPVDTNNSGIDSNGLTPSTDATVSPKMVNKLPNTSTDMFNLIVTGVILILGGGIYYFTNKRKMAHITKES